MTQAIQENGPKLKKRSFQFLLQSAIELIFFMPFLLTISIYFTSPLSCVIWGITLWLGYGVIQSTLNRRQKSKQYQAILLVAICVLIILAVQFQFSKVNLFGTIFISAVSFYILYSSILSIKHSWVNSFSVSLIVVILVGQIILQVLKVVWLTEIGVYQTVYAFFGMISFIIFLFIVNERMLGEHQHVDEKSRSFRSSLRLNRIIISCISIIIVLLTLFREVQREIEAWFLALINAIIAWFNGISFQERTDPLTVPPSNNHLMDGLVAEEEPSKFWKLLEPFLSFAATLLIATGIIVGLYFLVKKGIGIISAIINRLLNSLAVQMDESGEYVDVVEQLKQDKSANAKRMKRATRVKEWDSLTNNEKVRQIYTDLVTKERKAGYQLNATNTASQTLEEIANRKHFFEHQAEINELKAFYNEARYRDEPIEERKLKKVLKFFDNKN